MFIFLARPRSRFSTVLSRTPLRLRQQSTCSSNHAAEDESTRHLIKHPIEEGQLAGNRLAAFHPTKPGQILDGRYKTLAKLGFGTSSTVWLAENLRYTQCEESLIPRYVTIKIAALDTDASREVVNSKLINYANPSHEGLSFLRVPIDEFQLKATTSTDTHLCLVYEPMRETLFRLQHRLKRQRLALPLFKFYMYCLLQALDYLHTECRLIHTDIKDDNIMITLENEKILDDFVSACSKHPHPKHVSSMDGREVYLSHDDFGRLQGARLLPELADFNLCYPILGGGHGHLSPIQSHRYRAPEVLLGCPWTYSADIWSLGLLMWNLLEDVSLFNRPAGSDGEYDAHVHLAQMVSLLGDPPPALVAREKLLREHRLKDPVSNSRGDQYYNMNQYWGGPFFDENGTIFRQDLIQRGKLLANTVTELSGEEKETFLDFASSMLHWMPEKRKTAKELLEHPFFDSFYKEREDD